jgi:hydroxymethylpyrimidine pyrophosphatase-like HAD family hydrolase
VRAIRAALEAGIRVTLVTGRLYSGTRAVAELLGLRGAVGCADGSHLVRAADHATLLHLGVRGEEMRTLRGAFARAQVATFVFARDAIGHDEEGAPYVEYIATWSNDVRATSDVFAHELWEASDGVTAVVAVGSKDAIASVVDALAGDLPLAVKVAAFPLRRAAHAGRWATIVRSSAGTKGTAVRWIAKEEGVALSEAVCVGDWINDVPMFEAAGRSFAMSHAPDEVKAAATDHLPHTVEAGGGVAAAIEAAFGIGVPDD